MTWNVDPEIFRVGIFAVRWYGTLFTAAFVFGYFILKNIFRREGVPVRQLNLLTLYVAAGTIIGARLGHCLFYEPEYFLQNPIEMFFPVANFDGEWRFVGYQGLASHGGALGILAALYVYSHKQRVSYLWVLDRVVIVVALAGFFIRMGNLMNSEVIGYPTQMPWGFEFVRSPEWYIYMQPCHPTQIYEALAYLAIFFTLLRTYIIYNVKLFRGFIFGLFLVTLFSVRFLIEFLKIEQVSFEKGMLLNMGQLLSIPFIFCGFYFLFFHKKSVTLWQFFKKYGFKNN